MTLSVIDPSLRFDHLSFSSEIVNGHASSIYTSYTCPRCAEVVSFSRRDFEDRAQRRSSSLPAPLAVVIDSWAASSAIESQSFLDWQCPGCGLAVRAYARPWFGGRHGDHGTDIVALVELDPKEHLAW